ncbi:hypothetical protein D3C80_803740 [compost metagenome]
MAITLTSLTHPAMASKIRNAMSLAMKGQGHLMNGHANRCYIQNRKGHNIMRVDYRRGKGFYVWGAESTNITSMVHKALLASSVQQKAS